MRYSFSEEWTEKARGLARQLQFDHIDLGRIACVQSTGTKTRRIIARIHTLGKVMQLGMAQKPFYVIELISERFGKMQPEEQTKTLIHELLHIPHSFGGGFRHHKPYVNNKTVEEAFRKLGI
ncbi:MAG: metallopeptidase [Candidatus Diapherotrites archaeon]|uniref:Metallopeptidase n=1 Tax=Candidatus Iainarchaeum sp. TaxID=3101447 RepID=A0A938YMW6_9ARCH|nr:metallopeptidase [Candidatus Diapherotrites archaeon]